jgi:hypothetical protein
MKLKGKKNRIVSTKYYYDEPRMKDQTCGVCGRYGREYKALVGKGLLGIRMPRCDYTFKMEFKYMGQEGVDWINMVQDANKWRVLPNTLVKFLTP